VHPSPVINSLLKPGNNLQIFHWLQQFIPNNLYLNDFAEAL
jgi:hypothetical protein